MNSLWADAVWSSVLCDRAAGPIELIVMNASRSEASVLAQMVGRGGDDDD